MCIRDRNMVASIKEYLTGLTLPHMSWIDIIEILLIAVLAVSYTHLDVYKRQASAYPAV